MSATLHHRSSDDSREPLPLESHGHSDSVEPSTSSSAPAARATSRLVGVDLARGLALIGMMTVHVSIFDNDGEPGGVAGWLLAAPSGRASVLFFVLSGLSLSVIAARGSRSAEPAVLRRRGVVLMIGGLLLSAIAWSASILEHYGLMFVLAPWFLKRSNRELVMLSLLGLVGGPIALMFTNPVSEAVGELGSGAGSAAAGALWSILVTGNYPMILWFGFFSLGLILGRLDLRSTSTAGAIAIVGALGVAGVLGTTALLDSQGLTSPDSFDEQFAVSADDSTDEFLSEEELLAKFPKLSEENGAFVDDADGDDWFENGEWNDKAFELPDREWADLRSTTSHSGQIGWAVQSTFLAMTVLGLALLTPAALARVLKPLASLGSISLTAYLFHTVLVTDVWSRITGHADFTDSPSMGVNGQILTLLSLQAALVTMAVIIVREWKTGPFERGLKQLT